MSQRELYLSAGMRMIGVISQADLDVNIDLPWNAERLDVCDMVSFNPEALPDGIGRGFFKVVYLKAPQEAAGLLAAYLGVPHGYDGGTIHGIFVMERFVIGPTSRTIVRTRHGRFDLDG